MELGKLGVARISYQLRDERDVVQRVWSSIVASWARIQRIVLLIRQHLDDGLITNDLCCERPEFVDEDVIVDGVADGATNDTDGECDGGDRGDEVVRTDDSRDDGCGNDDTTDTETGQSDQTIHGAQVVWSANR